MIFIVILLGLIIICSTFLFILRKKDCFAIECGLLTFNIFSIIVLIGISIALIISNLSAEAYNKANTERYISLLYKAHTLEIRDNLGLDNKEYIDDIQHWNEDFVKIKTYQESPWLKDFYPEKLLLGLDRIDVTDVEFEEKEKENEENN